MGKIIGNLMAATQTKQKGQLSAKQTRQKSAKSFIGQLRGALATTSEKRTNTAQASLNQSQAAAKSLTALRRALLSKDPSLEKMSIQLKDISELNQFLLQNGWTAEEVDKVVQALNQKAENGRIKLSQFFSAVEENQPARFNDGTELTAAPAVVPFIEAQLRSFDFSPSKIANILQGAQDAQGRINLKRLAQALEQNSSEIKSPENKTALANFAQNLKQAVQMAANNQIEANSGQGSESLKTLVGEKQVVESATALQQLMAMSKANESKNKAMLAENKEGGGLKGENSSTNKDSDETSALIDRIVSKTVVEKSQNQAQSMRQQARMKMAATHTDALNASKAAASAETEMASLDEIVQQAGDTDSIGIDPKVLQSAVQVKKAASENVQERQPQTIKSADDVKSPVGVTQTPSSDTGESFKMNQVQARPAAQNLPAYLVDQVGRQMSRAMLRGDKTLKIQLKPPELGMVKIEMDVQHNTLKVNMVAENATVKELLLSNVGELRENLTQQGIQIENVNVQINNNQNTAFADAHQNRGNGSGTNRNSNRSDISPNENENQEVNPSMSTKGDHMVSLVA